MTEISTFDKHLTTTRNIGERLTKVIFLLYKYNRFTQTDEKEF